MSAPTRARPAPQQPGRPVPPPRRPVPWATALCAGLAVILASAPVVAIVAGSTWPGHVVGIVVLVVAVGLALHRAGPAVVTVGQVVATLLLLTGQFATTGVLGVVPGPTAFGDFGTLLVGAGDQIGTTTAPVPATPEILFLVTAAFGLVTTAMYLAAVGAGAPAAAGVPLLATFAVPAALADDLLPWWSMVAAAAGFGLLMVARRGARRQLVGGVALVAVAGVLALAAGTLAGFIGTAGRFGSTSGSGAGGTTGVGLSPFASLRGQLTQTEPVELFQVRGLPRATYLRALTLRDYVPESGWQVTRPDPGPPLPGILTADTAEGEIADVTVQNVSFRDYWLPLYGSPLVVGGIPDGRWTYDTRNDTAYTSRPRQDDTWTERALLINPSLAQLRNASGAGPGGEFLNVERVDPRVTALAKQVVGDSPTAMDKAIALQEFFTGPNSRFTYSLATAPSGGDDALVEFLTVGRQGFCEQYASAMAVMLRAVGVPSRVAIGFTGGRVDGDHRTVSTSDAHAWVEAFFPGVGWTTFDPTPLTDGRTVTPPYVAEALAERDGGAGTDPAQEDTPQGQDAGAAPTPPPLTPQADQQPAATPADGGPPVWPFVIAALVVLVALAAAAPAVLRARGRRRRLTTATAGGQGAAGAAWEELLAESADRGVEARPSDTVRGTARRIIREHRLGTDAQRALRHVVGAVEASWYGTGHPRAGELDEPVRIVREAIVAGTAMTMKERVLPRSVVARLRPSKAGSARESGPSGSEPDRDDERAAARR